MTTTIKKFSGKNLKRLIKRDGMTNEELAERLEVSTQTIAYWNGGKKIPSAPNFKRLAEIFNVPPECLTGDLPICTYEELESLYKEFEDLKTGNIPIKLLFKYLQILGGEYESFDFRRLDEGIIDGTPIFYLIKAKVDKQIKECFLELDLISESH